MRASVFSEFVKGFLFKFIYDFDVPLRSGI